MLSPPALDRRVIDSLRQLNQAGEPDFVQEVLTLFLADAPVRLTAIAAAASARDADALQRAAHALKGAAANIGAHQLQGLCRELEEMARGGNTAAATGRVVVMREEFVRVKAEIDQLL